MTKATGYNLDENFFWQRVIKLYRLELEVGIDAFEHERFGLEAHDEVRE